MRRFCNQYGLYLAVVWLVITPSFALAEETGTTAPTGLVIEENGNGSIRLEWSAPTNPTAPVERYAIMWTCPTCGSGYGIATGNVGDADALKTFMVIPQSLLPDDIYTFQIRADNDTLGVYSDYSNPATITIGSTPEPSPSPSPTPTTSPQPSEASPSPTESPTPSPSPTQTETTTVEPSPSPSTQSNNSTADTSTTTPTNTTEPSSPVPSQQQETVLVPVIPPSLPPSPIEIYTEPVPTPTIQPPELPLPEEVVLIYEEPAPVVEPLLEEIPTLPIPEIMPESPLIEPFKTPIIEQEPITEMVENQEPITAEQIENLVESLNEDGVLTEGEKEEIAEALIEQSEGEPITAETIIEAGLSYEDLPAATPVEVRQDESGNAVVITAEVAAALVVLESPVELLTTIFSDPAQALLAISSIGADMSDEERSESEQTIVAAVIVSGIAVQSATTAALAGSVSYRRRL